MVIIDSGKKRGCGHKREGGFYGVSKHGRGGTLSPWAWVFGDGVGCVPLCTVTPLGHRLGSLPLTLGHGLFVDDVQAAFMGKSLKGWAGQEYRELSRKVPKMSIFDHVGKVYYTPWSFSLEVEEQGVSRRFHPDFAHKLAQMRIMPIPIVFTHSDIPVFANETVRDMVVYLCLRLPGNWGKTPKDFSYSPTWKEAQWGIDAQHPDDGDAHFMVLILQALHALENGRLAGDLGVWDALKGVLFGPDVRFKEQVFGVSWVTNIGYVPKEEDTETDLGTLEQGGIDIIQLERGGFDE